MGINITGTGVALITPFNEDLSIDFSTFRKILDHATNNGVDYVVVNGTTAESATTSLEEKNALLKTAKEHLQGKYPIVYGIGGNDTSEILERIKNTDLSGVAAVLSVCPYYNKPSQEGIFQHYKLIAEKLPIPLILYNVPGRTGVNIKAKTSVRLSEVPNIIGIKEASGDIVQALEIMKNAKPGFQLISGDDMLTVPLISLGAKGVISVLANAFPAEFSKMVNLALSGKFSESTEILKSFTGLNPLLYEESNPVGIKQVMENLNISSSTVRLPLVKSSKELQEKIKERIKEVKS